VLPCEALAEDEARNRLEARGRIETASDAVRGPNGEVDRARATSAHRCGDRFEEPSAFAGASVLGADEDFGDEGVRSCEFEVVPEGPDGVAMEVPARPRLGHEHPAEARLAEQAPECRQSPLRPPGDAVGTAEGTHHGQELGQIR